MDIQKSLYFAYIHYWGMLIVQSKEVGFADICDVLSSYRNSTLNFDFLSSLMFAICSNMLLFAFLICTLSYHADILDVKGKDLFCLLNGKKMS